MPLINIPCFALVLTIAAVPAFAQEAPDPTAPSPTVTAPSREATSAPSNEVSSATADAATADAPDETMHDDSPDASNIEPEGEADEGDALPARVDADSEGAKAAKEAKSTTAPESDELKSGATADEVAVQPHAAVDNDLPAVALLDLETNKNVDESLAKVLNSLIAGAINKKPELKLVTMDEIRRVLDFEGDKSALGCVAEAQSCLAEIAGALGTDFVVFGDIGKIANDFVVKLSLYDTVNARSVGREQISAKGERDLAKKIAPMVDALFAPIAAASAGPVQDSDLRLPLLYAGGTAGTIGALITVTGAVISGVFVYLLYQKTTPGIIKTIAVPGWTVSAGFAAIGLVLAGGGAAAYGVGHVVE